MSDDHAAADQTRQEKPPLRGKGPRALTPQPLGWHQPTKAAAEDSAKCGGYWLLLLSPCELPMVEAKASFGTDETDRRSAIAGGVTVANLPHLFRNSRRSAMGSLRSGGADRSFMIGFPLDAGTCILNAPPASVSC
jgi:hypothetical protein